MRGWVLLVMGAAWGCVEVPDRVFGGAGDGAMARGDGAVDGDDGGGVGVVVDGGAAPDAWSGRAGDAVAGDAGAARPGVGEDGARCPVGGVWLAGVEGCVVFEALGALPGGRVAMAGAVTAGGRVWVGGGVDAAGAGVGSWVLAGEAWVAGPALAVGVAGAGAAAVGEVVWVVGGDVAGVAVQRVADGVAGAAGALGEARVGGFSVHGVGDGVLVVGGEAAAGGVAGVERVGGGAAPGLSVARWGHAAAVDGDGALWVVGGWDAAGGVVFAAETLAPGGLRWRPGPGGGAGFAAGAAVVAGGVLLVGGGVDAAGAASARVWRLVGAGFVETGALNRGQAGLTFSALGDAGAVLAVGPVGVEVFDPVLGVWFDVEPWVAGGARAGHVALAVGGAVVVVGGERDGRAVPTAWRARWVPPTD